MEQQVKHVNSKIAKNIGIINKLRYYLDLKMLKQLYYTLRPYLSIYDNNELGKYVLYSFI
jgi:flagellin-specific chaperone FliS